MVDYMLFTEVMALRQEVERIREQRDKALQERDQARREVCVLVCQVKQLEEVAPLEKITLLKYNEQQAIAAKNGWDCFKETP